MFTPVDLGEKTNIEVLNSLLDLSGKYVIDAGCGNMGFTKEIVKFGARVLAIDPDSKQSAGNRNQPSVDGLKFLEAGAEQLPVEDDSIDGVFFIYSLHHVPAKLYAQVFREIARAVKPGGFLHVIEPIACPLNDVMMLFHDEESERAAAQEALLQHALPLFEAVESVMYHGWRKFDGFDHFVGEFSDRTFNSGYSRADVCNPKVRELFERNGAPEYNFQSPKIVHCFTGLKP